MTEQEQLKEQVKLILSCPVPPMVAFAHITKSIVTAYKMMGMEPPKCECAGCEDCKEPASIQVRGKWYCGPCAWGAFITSPDGAELLSKGQAVTKEIYDDLKAKNEVGVAIEAVLMLLKKKLMDTSEQADEQEQPQEEEQE